MAGVNKITEILSLDHVRIVWRNFTGEAKKYNAAGDRNFHVVIDDVDLAHELLAKGWNIKIVPPSEDGDDWFCHMEVKVKFQPQYPGLDPKIYLQSGKNFGLLTADSVGAIDHMEILNVDMDIRPYNWSLPSGDSGVTAYVQGMCVTQKIDRFEANYQSSDDWRNQNQ